MLAWQQLWISYFSTNPYGVYNLDIRIIKPAAFGSKLKQCEKKQTNNNTLADSDKLFLGDYQNNSSSIIILALLLLLKMPTDQTHTWIINLESYTATHYYYALLCYKAAVRETSNQLATDSFQQRIMSFYYYILQ